MEITVVKVKVMTLSKGMLKQIEKVCGNKNGELIGYVIGDTEMVSFIGKEAGKLYQTRQDYMMDTFLSQGKPVTFKTLPHAIDELKAKLPQIFI